MHVPVSSTSNHRARWAAIGAAVAVSLGAGGLGIVTATSPEGASAYIPITPCRIMDTRPGDGEVGPQAGPLVGPDAETTVDGWGDVAGDCNLPSNTTGLQLNVTATDASQLTNLRFYPEGADTPTASNLNPSPGAAPTSNAVTVGLNSTNGKFHVFNRFGSVHVIIDVQGYYTDHDHDDRYYTKTEADDRFASPPAGVVLLQPQDFVATTSPTSSRPVPATRTRCSRSNTTRPTPQLSRPICRLLLRRSRTGRNASTSAPPTPSHSAT